MSEFNLKELPLFPGAYSGGAGAGSFGILSPATGKFADKFNISWHGCREEFANQAYQGAAPRNSFGCTMSLDGFTFCMSDQKTVLDISEFISKFEALLEVGRRKPLQRSLIQGITTNGTLNSNYEKQIVWVSPAPFWTKQPMRLSLFTMLFRCANQGYKAGDGDFFSALFNSYNLAIGCRSSISRFLDGYTWYNGKATGLGNDGWYNAFHDAGTTNANCKNLIRPKKKEKPVEVSKDAILKNEEKIVPWESSDLSGDGLAKLFKASEAKVAKI